MEIFLSQKKIIKIYAEYDIFFDKNFVVFQKKLYF
jgi:hypothetical protein